MQFLQYCTEFVAIHTWPFSHLNGLAFRKLLKEQLDELSVFGIKVNLKDKNLPVLKNYIQSFSRKLKAEIAFELKYRYVSLIVDVATKRDGSILGISVQFVNNGSVYVRSIGMVQLKKVHTADHIKEMIKMKLNEFLLNLWQIVSITTDNVKNMIKMVRTFKVVPTESGAQNKEGEICEDDNVTIQFLYIIYVDMIYY